MTFRIRLLVVFAITIAAAVSTVVWAVSTTTRNAFERENAQRTAALIAQFRREFRQREDEVARKVSAIAAADSTVQIAIDVSRPGADTSPYVDSAANLASANGLDFLELAGRDGGIISSAQWPARFGYKEIWLTQQTDWNSEPAFLKREELPNENALGLIAVRTVNAGQLYVAGGARLDSKFLDSLAMPAGTRALLFANQEPGGATLQPLIERVRQSAGEQTLSTAGETFHAIPLLGSPNDLAAAQPPGRPVLLGVLVIGTSRRELLDLIRFIRNTGLVVGASGILLALVIAGWATARVTRPVKELARGAREVASGNWEARVDIHSTDEIGALADAFNQMTRQLMEQRERLIQTERVAAWRELARRLAHELKNPLFPLQITIENMQRARRLDAAQFDEVFRESTTTLLAELANLKTIIGRFSDFAKMPRPELQSVDLNELVREVLRLFDAQLQAIPVSSEVTLDDRLRSVNADPEQLKRALQNLILNALDAMPEGGELSVLTEQRGSSARITISDTGKGLTSEECERLFTPYYTTKQHGTGLGLAIVQSVVSDHGGTISLESGPERGTAFRIELPQNGPAQAMGT